MNGHAVDPSGVWVVIVNWNGADDTIGCIGSLVAAGFPVSRVVVVDNGSTDASVARLRAACSGTSVIDTGTNGGFAAGCNLGIAAARQSGAAWVWLLNNDARVEPDTLPSLLRCAATDDRIAAVGAVIVSPDGHLGVEAWGGGWIDDRVGRAGHYRERPPRGHVDYLVGASLLLRVAALDGERPLDDGFFLYWEDGDLCRRLRAGGWRLAVAEDARVRHRAHGSLAASNPWFDYHYNASAVRFFRRHASYPIAPILIGAAARCCRRLVRGEWRRAAAVWRGTRAGLIAARRGGAASGADGVTRV